MQLTISCYGYKNQQLINTEKTLITNLWKSKLSDEKFVRKSFHPNIFECVEYMHSNYVQFQALLDIDSSELKAGDRFQF